MELGVGGVGAQFLPAQDARAGIGHVQVRQCPGDLVAEVLALPPGLPGGPLRRVAQGLQGVGGGDVGHEEVHLLEGR